MAKQGRKISAKALVEDIRNGTTDAELLRKHGVSQKSLEKFFDQLVAKGLLTPDDVERRRASAEPVDKEKAVTPKGSAAIPGAGTESAERSTASKTDRNPHNVLLAASKPMEHMTAQAAAPRIPGEKRTSSATLPKTGAEHPEAMASSQAHESGKAAADGAPVPTTPERQKDQAWNPGFWSCAWAGIKDQVIVNAFFGVCLPSIVLVFVLFEHRSQQEVVLNPSAKGLGIYTVLTLLWLLLLLLVARRTGHPLKRAIEVGSHRAVKRLLSKGIDPNAPITRRNLVPLVCAVELDPGKSKRKRRRTVEIAEMIWQAGGRFGTERHREPVLAALESVLRRKDQEMTDWLRSKGVFDYDGADEAVRRSRTLGAPLSVGDRIAYHWGSMLLYLIGTGLFFGSIYLIPVGLWLLAVIGIPLSMYVTHVANKWNRMAKEGRQA